MWEMRPSCCLEVTVRGGGAGKSAGIDKMKREVSWYD
jgi:hypothetical protein